MQKTITAKICFVSLGCPKALVDSEQIITRLQNDNYQIVADYEGADLVIVNTCGFINPAIQESLETISAALEQNGKVIVTGCLGTKREFIKQQCPNVLAITGPNSTDEVIQEVHQFLPPASTSCCSGILQHVRLTPPHYAYLKIAEGCNRHCSYCIIPQLRGPLISRPMNEIMVQAEELVASGVKELLVIAQDSSAYGTDLRDKKSNLINLAKNLSKLGIWIRLHYLYPYPLIDELLPLMAENKIVPYLDVPLQHASPKILKAMHRPASDQDMLQRISKWRSICPNITIRSTFIVGFPGETAADFNYLLDFLKQAQLDRVGCFQYSAVEGANANNLTHHVAESVKQQRFDKLMTLQQKISQNRLEQKIGRNFTVIVDSIQNGVAVARSTADAPEIDGQVFINNPDAIKPGDFVNVRIQDNDAYDLWGSPIPKGLHKHTNQKH